MACARLRWGGSVLPVPPPERLALPSPPAPAARQGFPVVATLAPVVVSLALWMLTGSAYSLLFAVLGPVDAVGGLVDGRVGRRRTVRRERVRYLAGLQRTADAVAGAHGRERDRLERLTADAGWGRERGGPVPVRVGWGTLAGRVQLSGDDPEDAPDEVVAALREVRDAAGAVRAAPVVADARENIGIVGAPVPAASVARAAAIQAATRLSPADVVLAAPAGEAWTEYLPHSVATGEAGRFTFHEEGRDPIVISWAGSESGLARGCGILIADHRVRGTGTGETALDLRPAGQTTAEASVSARELRERADAQGIRPAAEVLPVRVELDDLLPLPPDGRGALAAPIGRDAEGTVVVDLVAQGPHAVVAGTTGSGKSELLVAWVLGIASGRSPDEVAFLLVDFKGGSAFAPLAVLPHVLATLSDLDARGTDRAIESLRAELRQRERVLADAGVRSIDELAAGVLPRLVVVVDEFAALVSASPELHDVFADLAARGRSLGLHLILCTQRPAGVIRDAVLANATLRVSLRVADRTDSVAMLGDDAAARLPAEPRGRAILAHDGPARTFQVAIARPSDAGRIAAESAPAASLPAASLPAASPPAASPPAGGRRPWCDPLPLVLPYSSLAPAERGLPFGLVDLPAEQRQPTAVHDPARHGHLLVLGGGGAGSTTALETLAVSGVRAGLRVRRVPADPADAWAALVREAEEPPEGWTLLLLDDLDALTGRFDADYRAEFLDLLAALARGTGPARPALVVAAHRLTGALSGIAGLFGSRLLLRQTSREEHVLAGGDPRGFDPDLPPGAGTWRGAVVQVALAGEAERGTLAERNAVGQDGAELPQPIAPTDHPVLAIVAGRPRAYLGRLRATGAHVIELGGASIPTLEQLRLLGAATPRVLLGDPEAWLADWALLAAARRDWPIVLIDVTAADHRAVLRDRALPPPLGAAPGECWISAEGRTRRAVLVLPDPTRESEEKHPRNR
jgi:S-DNA-T family DNA segregation ATPase FtsK/SpoIIIE